MIVQNQFHCTRLYTDPSFKTGSNDEQKLVFQSMMGFCQTCLILTEWSSLDFQTLNLIDLHFIWKVYRFVRGERLQGRLEVEIVRCVSIQERFNVSPNGFVRNVNASVTFTRMCHMWMWMSHSWWGRLAKRRTFSCIKVQRLLKKKRDFPDTEWGKEVFEFKKCRRQWHNQNWWCR